jgi:hypothetical protein
MGMYDSVTFNCPSGCPDRLEVQSKAGPCLLGEIDQSEVPREIAEDVVGDTVRCDTCDLLWRVTIVSRSTVRMELRE